MLSNGQITDANCYHNDRDLIGVLDMFDIPEMETERHEHKTLGSIGILKLPKRGGVQALEGSMEFSFPEPEMVALTSRPNKMEQFQMHQPLDVFGPEGWSQDLSTTIITQVSVMFHKRAWPKGSKDAEKYQADFTCYRVIQRLLNSDAYLLEYDVYGRVYNVDGQPVWS